MDMPMRRPLHRERILAHAVFTWALVAWGGCGDGGSSGNNQPPDCLEGYRGSGPACVPVFDDPSDCPDPNQMPTFGGGCQSVGVPHCPAGFQRDDVGGCVPTTPDHQCPPGTMAVIGQTDCQEVGVTQCDQGFQSDGEGGCEAILPPGLEACPQGTIALLGHETCQPLGDCGTGPEHGGSPWGNIQGDVTTIYVDATADASGANGSESAPYPTLGEALVAVQAGGQIAVAAGEYVEAVEIDKPLRLKGRCSALVTLRGTMWLSQPTPALRIAAGGAGSEVRGLTLTGPGTGLVVAGAQQVTVANVEVRNTVSYGVSVGGGSEIGLERVVVAECGTMGVFVNGGTLSMSHSVVRDTLARPTDDMFGRGINSQCASANVCGDLTVSDSLVTGNRDMGIFVVGVEATVTGSVVSDTLARETDDRGGRGIAAQCDDLYECCGSLTVTGSLVTGNRDVGVYASGVETAITESVVRDTLPRDRDGGGGRGVSAQCNISLERCAPLTVTNSLVTGNREAGVFSGGAETTVTGSVVSDTLARETDEDFGRGIDAECHPQLGACGSLTVTDSLVHGNRDSGVYAWGVEAVVTGSVVRDTLARQSDLAHGRGIDAECDQGLEVCGSLTVTRSLVTGNREMGIFAAGTAATVTDSVVSGTLPQQSDQENGIGIRGQCYEALNICESLDVIGSLVTGNRTVGIFAEGIAATVTDSVVSGTLAQEKDGSFGEGIAAQCNARQGTCGSLTVTDSLVASNRESGIFIMGVDATITGTVVSGAWPQGSEPAAGRGINAQCDPDRWVCGRLTVTRSLVTGNRDLGIFVAGVDVTVTGTVVSGTLPRLSDQSGGRGIEVHCHPGAGTCGSFAMLESLVAHNEDAGIFIAGVPTNLQGVLVTDTVSNAGGLWPGENGQGIWAQCYPDSDQCGTLSLTSCEVTSSFSAGVAMEGVSGSMVSSLVDSVAPQPKESRYGYGIQIGGREGRAQPTFHTHGCSIRDASLTGVLYYRSQGVLSGSVVSGAEYSVVMTEGSAPTIAQDNTLAGTVQDEPEWASLYPAPSPPPSTPVGALGSP